MDSSAATLTNKPIFVVGSPRSGTSILTWCLGQHPNMLVIPESAWMGDFAIDLAIRYQIGTATRRSVGAKCNGHRARGVLRALRQEHQRFNPESPQRSREKAVGIIVLAKVVWSP